MSFVISFLTMSTFIPDILHDPVFKSNDSSMILVTKFRIKIMPTKPSQTL